jgi:hypothetical protein
MYANALLFRLHAKEKVMRKWLYVSVVIVPLGLAAAWGQAPSDGKQKEDRDRNPGQPAKEGREKPQPVVKKTTTVPAAVQPAVARSRVVKVTVYHSGALVTREVEVPAGQGLVELVVSGLPERVQNRTLYSEGAEGLRVLSTRFRTRPVFEDTREDVRLLVDTKKKLEQNAQKIQADLNAVKMNQKLLDKMENFTDKSTVLSVEKGGLNGDSAITLAKYVMEQRGERAKEQVALEQKLADNADELKFNERKLNDLTSRPNRTERDAVLLVDREAGMGGKVRLNYLVDEKSAAWRPQYKLRAGAAKEPVQVDYQALLVQQTGEDWGNVDLTLSTAQPMLNAAPPELQVLELRVVALASLPGGGKGPGGFPGGGGFGGIPAPVQPQMPAMDLQKRAEALRSQAAQTYNSLKDSKKAVLELNEAAALDQTQELMKTREQLVMEERAEKRLVAANEGPSVSFRLPARLTVPSRTDEQVIEITKLKLEPKYYYKAVPVLARHVYRLADLTNKSSHVLLPGEATMYQGSDFVGRMTMPLVAIGEEFTAGFGVDPQLQIQRQMMDQTRTMQGGNQVLTYKYRILVSSYKSEPVQVQVWDRLPHATEVELAGVTLLKSSQPLSKDALYERESRPNNLLRWDLEVAPNTNSERAVALTYEFKLELDRNKAISGLLTR